MEMCAGRARRARVVACVRTRCAHAPLSTQTLLRNLAGTRQRKVRLSASSTCSKLPPGVPVTQTTACVPEGSGMRDKTFSTCLPRPIARVTGRRQRQW